MTPSQARVIDPILTEVARGFVSVGTPVADILFPRVQVGQRGGKIISFGPDDYRLYNTARAPGAATKRVRYGYASGDFALVDYSLEGEVPIELQQEAETVPGIDMGAGAVNSVRTAQAIEREKQASDLALDPGAYTSGNKQALAAGYRWDDDGGDPARDVNIGKETIRSQIGVRPNVLIAGPKSISALRNNPKLLARLSITEMRTPATLAQLALLLEVEQVIEASAVYHDGTKFVDMWGAAAILAYTKPASLSARGSPNYGYTYQLAEYPYAEDPYFERNTKTWYYPVTDARQVVLVGPAAGFLFMNTASAAQQFFGAAAVANA